MTGIGFFDQPGSLYACGAADSLLVPFQTTAGKEQRADEPLANCSKNVRITDS